MIKQLYGVSSGNGNDGVSHMFPDYYVRSDNPWHVAKLAMITEFKPEYQQWAKDNVEVDGEAEYTVHAVIYDPPDDDTENGSWSESNGAWRLIDVFPEDDPRDGKMIYEDIESCFGKDILEKFLA